MRKELRGKLCAYCSVEPGTTPDHVFARAFLPADKRDGLPTVPACEACNNKKAKLEHYLTAVLPFGGLHPDAHHVLATMVPARLDNNERLRRELSAGMERASVTAPHGATKQTVAVPIDGDQVIELFEYMVRGLAWHHWPETLSPDHGVKVWTVTQHGKTVVWDEHLSRMNSPKRIAGNLGDGALTYEAALGVGGDHLSVWRVRVFGGAVIRGDADVRPENDSTDIIALVGREKFLARIDFE
jgi:hypothetical protein